MFKKPARRDYDSPVYSHRFLYRVLIATLFDQIFRVLLILKKKINNKSSSA